jgi:hypothetical protein
MDLVIVFACGMALIVMLVICFVAAYKTVNNSSTVCEPHSQKEGEVPLDDICCKYLKLTNLD